MPHSPAARLAELRQRTGPMLESLAAIVATESPSADLALLATCATSVARLGADATGADPQDVGNGGRPHLEWRFGATHRVALIGHFDTVWPAGTISRWPFSTDGTTATGPGAFDMKAGIVQLFAALSTLDDLDGVTVVLTSDEELGSQSSRRLVESAAHGARAALVLEPSGRDGALKVARKGTGMYTLHVDGRAAHAGLEPERGVNALVEAAHLVLASASVARPEVGTTVTPTMASAGTATNVVPPTASVELDVRVALPEEAARVDAELRALRTSVAGSALRIDGGPNRPPMPRVAAEALFDMARDCARELGIAPPGGVEVGGASDGNFTAGVGTPTLDGLGAVGDGAHAEGEHVVVAAMAERAALLAAMIESLLREEPPITAR